MKKNAFIHINLHKNHSHHRDNYPVTLKLTIFTGKFLNRTLQKIISFLKTRYLSLSLTKKIALVLGILIIYISLPSYRYSFKVFGFLEKDFLKSTTGSAFETNKESYFKALIGDINDNTKTQISFRVQGDEFTFTYLPGTVSASKKENKNATSSSTLQEKMASDSAKTASTSPAFASPSAQSANILGLMEDIRVKIASLSADIAEISGNINNVRNEVLDVVGGIEQSFEGPHEIVRQKGTFIGDISYYLNSHDLIEKWSYSEPEKNILPFIFSGKNLTVKVKSDQTWEILKDKQVLMTVKTTVTDKKNKEIALPQIEEKNYSSNGQIDLILPNDKQIQDAVLPLNISRSFIPAKETDNSPEKLLTRFAGSELAPNSVVVGPMPQLLHRSGESILVYDGIERNLISVSSREITAPLFTDISANGLSCADLGCLISLSDRFYIFNPDELKNLLPGTDKDTLIQTVETVDNPIGGITQSGKYVYYSSNNSPQGTIYRLKNLESKEEKIISDLSNPKYITINAKGNQIAFLGDGQLQIVDIESKNRKTVALQEQIEALSYGPENQLFAVMPYPKLNTKIIIRIWPDGETVEILNNASGEFTGIFADMEGLILGVKLDQKYGAVIPIPWDKTQWHLQNEYE